MDAKRLMSCVKVEVAVPAELPVPNSPYGFCERKATLNLHSDLRSCVKVEVAIQGSPFLIVLMVSVNVKQH